MAINDEGSYIEGIKYDFVSNMLCSFHNEASRIRKLSFKSNLETADNTICINKSNSRTMFIKADQLYYFGKAKIHIM